MTGFVGERGPSGNPRNLATVLKSSPSTLKDFQSISATTGNQSTKILSVHAHEKGINVKQLDESVGAAIETSTQIPQPSTLLDATKVEELMSEQLGEKNQKASRKESAKLKQHYSPLSFETPQSTKSLGLEFKGGIPEVTLTTGSKDIQFGKSQGISTVEPVVIGDQLRYIDPFSAGETKFQSVDDASVRQMNDEHKVPGGCCGHVESPQHKVNSASPLFPLNTNDQIDGKSSENVARYSPSEVKESSFVCTENRSTRYDEILTLQFPAPTLGIGNVEPFSCVSKSLEKTTAVDDVFAQHVKSIKPKSDLQQSNIRVSAIVGEEQRSMAGMDTCQRTMTLACALGKSDIFQTFFIDPGADLSVISLEAVQRTGIPIYPTTVKMYTADRKPMECLGYIDTTMEIFWKGPSAACADTLSTIEGLRFMALVTPVLNEIALIGRDFLEEHNAIIHFDRKNPSISLQHNGETRLLRCAGNIPIFDKRKCNSRRVNAIQIGSDPKLSRKFTMGVLARELGVVRQVSTTPEPTSLPTEQSAVKSLGKSSLRQEMESWDHLTSEEKDALAIMLNEFDESTLRVAKLPFVKEYFADIILEPGTKPIKMKDRMWNPQQKKQIEKEVTELLTQGWIQKSFGPWAARLVPVLKPDGSTRICVDYRLLNNVTKADAYPSANPEIILDNLNGKKYFTKMDAMKGYYQILLAFCARELTAFTCPLGLFEFIRMPFGLKNAPAIFQRLMDELLGDLKGKFLDVLMDDIIIYSNTFEEHIEHIRIVLTRLRDKGIALRFDKCSFACPELKFLGHIVNREGKRIDPSKIEAVCNFAPPTRKKQVRSFLGMAGFVRKYVKDFSKHTRLLTNLTRKEVPERDIAMYWTPEHQAEFDYVKKLLVEAPVLAHPDFDRPFIVETDASDYAVGAVLLQEYKDEDGKSFNRPVAYASAKLNDAQKNYDVTSREGLAIVWALDKFEHYLKRFPVTIVTDHCALSTTQTRRHAAQRIERWRQRIQEFMPIFVYRSGKLNHGADSMSRLERIDEQPILQHDYDRHEVGLTINRVQMTPPEIKLNPEEWLRDQEDDPITKNIRDYLVSGRSKDSILPKYFCQSQHSTHEIRSDNLLYLIQKGRPLLVVPKIRIPELLTKYHNDTSTSGEGSHFGVHKVMSTLQQFCWWPRMYTTIEEWIRDCQVCQRIRQGIRRPVVQVNTDLQASKPMEVVGVDCIALPETPESSKALVVVDHFTRFVWIFDMPNIETKTVARRLEESIFRSFGWPKYLVSDGGTEFRSNYLVKLCESMSTENRFISAHHPQANLVEGQNKTIIQQLSAFQAQNDTRWVEEIGKISWRYNTAVITSLNVSPYELMFGVRYKSQWEQQVMLTDPSLLTPQHLESELQEKRTLAKEERMLTRQKAREKFNAERKASLPMFVEGQLVWAKNFTAVEGRHHDRNLKLEPRWLGPFVVLKKSANTVSFVCRPLGGEQQRTIHAVDLKALINGTGGIVQLYHPYIHHSDDKDETEKGVSGGYRPRVLGERYEVEGVEDHRWKENKLQFLIRWKGYGEPTWETELNLNCHEYVHNYVKSLGRVSELRMPDAQEE